jgi:hypothetical protein
MTAKEKVQERLARWSEEQAERALDAAEDEPGAIAIEDKRDSQPTSDALAAAASRARAFLISVAKGTSGLDLDQLRTVRERAWR